jgi:hypothetical protein
MLTIVVSPSYEVCTNPTPREYIEGRIALKFNDNKCYDLYFNGVSGNPPIKFEGMEPHTKIVVQGNEAQAVDGFYFEARTPSVQEIIVTKDLSDSSCKSIGEPGNPFDTVIASYGGELWVHDPRFVSCTHRVVNVAVNAFLVLFSHLLVRAKTHALLTLV